MHPEVLKPNGGRSDKWIAQRALESVYAAIVESTAVTPSSSSSSSATVVLVPSLALSELYSRAAAVAPLRKATSRSPSQSDGSKTAATDDFLGNTAADEAGATGGAEASTRVDLNALPSMLDVTRGTASSHVGSRRSSEPVKRKNVRIAGLSQTDQRRLAAVADLWKSTLSDEAMRAGGAPNLDDCGWRYFIAHKLREAMTDDLRPDALGTNDCAWALHCRDHDGLLELVGWCFRMRAWLVAKASSDRKPHGSCRPVLSGAARRKGGENVGHSPALWANALAPRSPC